MNTPAKVKREYCLVPFIKKDQTSIKTAETLINVLALEGFQLRSDGESGVFVMERQSATEDGPA